MERMKQDIKYVSIGMYKQLEEENKKLRECNKSQSEVINNVFIPQKERLEEENKSMKEDLENAKPIMEMAQQRMEENKKLKEERDLYKARNEELNEDCFGLANENKNLKLENADLMGERDGLKMVVERLQKEIEELEKQYQHSMGFSDFGGYDD